MFAEASGITMVLRFVMCDPSVRRLKRAEDDKIELNRKMNANLEAQAQALFKSWFVDFAPWGGKGLRGGRVPARAIGQSAPVQ